MLLTPQQKALWNGIAQDASALTKSPESKMAKALAGKPPGQVASYAFQPGELDRTIEFKSITDTQTYDQLVKSWVGQFVKEAQDLTPAQLSAKLRPLLRQPPDNPSACYPPCITGRPPSG